MENLDTNAILNIAENMNITDILSLCQTSKQMKKVCDSRLLWRQLLIRDYGVKFNYQADVFPPYNREKDIYLRLLNDTLHEVLFEKDENSENSDKHNAIKHVVAFELYHTIDYNLITPEGEKLNYIKNTNTHEMLKTVAQNGYETEIELDTFESAFGYIEGIDPSGIVQKIIYNFDVGDRRIIYPQIINFLTNEGYILKD